MAKEAANNLAWDGGTPAGKGGSVARRLRVGIIDADLLDHGTRHPNLALMKLSGWLKGVHRKEPSNELMSEIDYSSRPDVDVRLVLEPDLRNQSLEQLCTKFDKFIISKVFDFSDLPEVFREEWNADFDRAPAERIFTEGDDEHLGWYRDRAHRFIFGGTGFIPDLAKRDHVSDVRLPNNLPQEIEHAFPDYHLYDQFVELEKLAGKKAEHYKDYENFSIGFLSRGCFRRCAFCVNRNYRNVTPHSPLIEFFDPKREHVYLWDDNFFGLISHANPAGGHGGYNASWASMLEHLRRTGKSFQFRQGLDIRLMTPELAEEFSTCKYYGDYIFAFDHYAQKREIITGLLHWKRANETSIPKFYVLCGFRHEGRAVDDIYETMKRVRILMHFGALPYIMRHLDYKKSPFCGLYTQLARWCNQPQFFKKKSFAEFIQANQYYHEKGAHRNPKCASQVALDTFLSHEGTTRNGITTQAIADEFFHLKWQDLRWKWKTESYYGEPGLQPKEDI